MEGGTGDPHFGLLMIWVAVFSVVCILLCVSVFFVHHHILVFIIQQPLCWRAHATHEME